MTQLTIPFTYPYFDGPYEYIPASTGPYYLTANFTYPYYTGGRIAPPVVPPPAPWQVSIGGHNYLVDTSFEPYRREAFRHRSIAAQKANITVDNIPGEATIDSQGLWRRISQDWSLGSGQLYFDRKESVDNRFRQSKGINVWTQWQATLLPETTKVYSTTSGIIKPLMAGQVLYVLDDTTIKYTRDLVTWTTLTETQDGTLPNDIVDIATNGETVWMASLSLGLFSVPAGGTKATIVYTPSADMVRFTGDRLIMAFGPSIYNIESTGQSGEIATTTAPLTSPCTNLPVTSTTADVNAGDNITVFEFSGFQSQTFIASADTPTGSTNIPVESAILNFAYLTSALVFDINPLWTHENPIWIWVDASFGEAQIYLAGYVNTSPTPSGPCAIYRTTVDSNGIDLIVPVLALPLEGGEYPTCLGGYLNITFVGTNLGLRMCETLNVYDPGAAAQGDLKSGPLLPSIIQQVTAPVTAVFGNGRFVYFTWNDFDSTSTGLGRCDLSHFIDTLTPAYASDLMATGQGNCQACWCTINDSPVFSVPGQGLFVSGNAPVASGYIDSGLVTYGIPDDKIAMLLGYRTNGYGTTLGQVSVEPTLTPDFATGEISVEAPGSTYGETTPGQADSQWPLPQLTGEYYEVRTTLEYDAPYGVPVLSRWMLQSIPAVTAGIEISVVLMLFRTVEEKGLLEPINVYQEYLYLESIRRTQQVVYYVEGPFKVLVTVDSLDWIPHAENNADPNRGYNGDIVVYLKTWAPVEVDEIPTYVTST